MTDWTSELNSMLGSPDGPPEDIDDAIMKENVAELGLSFPDDFIQFARRYGTGDFCTGVYRFSVGSPFFRGWRQGCESWYKNNHYIRGRVATGGGFGLPVSSGTVTAGGEHRRAKPPGGATQPTQGCL